MYTIQYLKHLSPDAINILVVEKLGFESNGNGAWHRGDDVVTLHGSCSDGCGGIGGDFDALADYQGDLNASHEMEKELADQRNSSNGSRMPYYRHILREICYETGNKLTGAPERASARQRCMAFLLITENDSVDTKAPKKARN